MSEWWAAISEWLAALLLLVGGAFMLSAGLGVARFPDLFTRMSAATKGVTLGIACLLLAVAVHFGNLDITARAVLVIAFALLTAPVAAHMIARAAYSIGVPLWEGTIVDELRGHHGRPAEQLAEERRDAERDPSGEARGARGEK